MSDSEYNGVLENELEENESEERETQEKESDSQARKTKEKSKRIMQNDLPKLPLGDTLQVCQAMYDNVANSSIDFENLASLLGMKPNNNKAKYAIWGAEAYGLIIKDELKKYSLSETGRKIVAPTYPGEENEAKRKAILTPTILSKFYIEYNKHPLPTEVYFTNLLETNFGIPRDRASEAKDIILSNAKLAQIFNVDSNTGKEIIDLDEQTDSQVTRSSDLQPGITPKSDVIEESGKTQIWNTTCFIICPIGDEGSTERKHSDMILKHVVKPVLEANGFSVVRADQIERSGLITQQILEHLV